MNAKVKSALAAAAIAVALPVAAAPSATAMSCGMYISGISYYYGNCTPSYVSLYTKRFPWSSYACETVAPWSVGWIGNGWNHSYYIKYGRC